MDEIDLRTIDSKFVEILLEEYFADNNSVINDFYIIKLSEDIEKKVFRFKVWLSRPTDNKIDGFTGYLFFYRNRVKIKLPMVKEKQIDDALILKAVQLFQRIYLTKRVYY
ncbi:hypothetical protein [Sulfolobus acidocaldarius]|uniref:Uncharacterized protein n=4 Tax=Sulfolobus acidocaldarius TaxID=2285 RepID=Q4J9F7_SULAC|nr:hypothetical protein [Sulfolobus acidocaldarius]AAY80571.1 hypothetical protein Saci_1225 [Sulfolobus acidocaldarius DSM 639]AGE71160.1 hypothetical protein SacN8_05975 [Sulfolobus acidocaldarius N8]AGE73430.1 hypothetical protein SacRon12I_05970 [Sulfolobus acidocaldarius Ron12/I]ALU28570.1 hypothetical protein ATY89_00375 [Sulfolobus acidocaldarius]ALU31282.1 hypothetical protein ATZ20_03420 [Sulfolobus acidocaldarius]